MSVCWGEIILCKGNSFWNNAGGWILCSNYSFVRDGCKYDIEKRTLYLVCVIDRLRFMRSFPICFLGPYYPRLAHRSVIQTFHPPINLIQRFSMFFNLCFIINQKPKGAAGVSGLFPLSANFHFLFIFNFLLVTFFILLFSIFLSKLFSFFPACLLLLFCSV